MKKGLFWIVLSCLMVLSMILASCTASIVTTATTIISTSQTTTPTTTSITPTITSPTSSTTSAVITTSATTTSTGNWWDSLGTPQYGGTITFSLNTNIVNFDPCIISGMGINPAYMERLITDNWLEDPSIFNYQIGFRPVDYDKGYLESSWETPDSSTYIAHIRQNVYWQNITPANGRQFVASDIVYDFDRYLGLGNGYTKPPTTANASLYASLVSVSATDNFTVVFKWSSTSLESMYENMGSMGPSIDFESPDAVQLWGNLIDWHHAIGTGPFILTDFVDNSSATLVKNQNYWGYDERYPQNKLPYVNSLNVLIIANMPTALAAMRAGKIDEISGVSTQLAQNMQVTNPAIKQIAVPGPAGTIDPRNDVAPFTDIRVREAMQMAINVPEIAKTYFGGTADPYPVSLTSRYMTGWGDTYPNWPADLQAQYAYNPTQAKQLLAQAGFPNGFNTDIVADASSDQNELLIVQSDFAAIGINMSIRLMDSAAWTAYVNAHLDDQITTRSSPSLGFAFEPLIQLKHFMTGFSNTSMVTGTGFDAFYPAALAATSIDQVKQVLQQANLYVAQQHFCISLCQTTQVTLSEPWLKGYNGQNHSLYGGSNGPLLLCFYGARFWIDKSQK
jgi:peptide/nickel transport system substrate-binding protein